MILPKNFGVKMYSSILRKLRKICVGFLRVSAAARSVEFTFGVTDRVSHRSFLKIFADFPFTIPR